jgi:CHAD domain-containing protein
MKYLPGKSLLDQYIKPITRLYVNQCILDEHTTHEIRVSIKRIRAMLILHEALTESPPGAELNQHLMQLNHALAKQRDRDVMLESLDKLIEQVEDTNIIQLLSSAKTGISAAVSSQPLDTDAIEIMTSDLLNDYQDFPLIEIRVKKIQAYLKKKLGKVCKNGARALTSADCLSLHKWRKQVKRLYYQNGALDAVCGNSPLPGKTLDKLGEKLGEMHDLCVLETALQNLQLDTPLPSASADFEKTYCLLGERRKQILQQCRRLYKKLCVK